MLHSIIEIGDYVGGFFLLEEFSPPYIYWFKVIVSKNDRTFNICLEKKDYEEKGFETGKYFFTVSERNLGKPSSKTYEKKLLDEPLSSELFFYKSLEVIKKKFQPTKEFKILEFERENIISRFNELYYGENPLDFEELLLYFYGNKKIFNARLAKAKELDFSNGCIKDVPETICDYFTLEKLILPKEVIVELPLEIYKLKKLKYLDISSNCLMDFPYQLVWLSNLETLLVGYVTSLPDNISYLKKLKKIHVTGFPFLMEDAFPEKITELNDLEYLRINEFSIKTLPETIGKLKKLRVLHLEDNWIRTLPSSISNLVNLELLVLSYNALSTLPDEVFMLENLKEIWLAGNPKLDEKELRLKQKKFGKQNKPELIFWK